MARRPQNLDLSVVEASIGENGRLTPRRPNFYMDLPSPRAGEVPPALSPLDAFALHSRALARRLEESSKTGKRMSRLPHHEIETELAKRPGYFRTVSSDSDVYSEMTDDYDEEEDEQETQGHVQITAKDERPVSHYPFLGNITTEGDRPESTTKDGLLAPRGSQPRENDGQGYFGIQVPRSSSPEPFDPQASKLGGVSPAVPSLTSSMDSIGSSQPRTLTNESALSRQHQTGLAPPKSPLPPRTARSIASIRSVIDSAEEDNGGPGLGKRSFSKGSAASTPLSPESQPISPSLSAMSELSASESLPRPSFNFSRPRSSSGSKLAFDRRPSFDTRSATRKPSHGSSLKDAVSNTVESDNLSSAESLFIRAPSRQNSDRLPIRGPSRQNSDHLPIRGPSRQNSDHLSTRGPSRQDSDHLSIRGPSRQNSETRSIRAPSRQNSENNSVRGPPSRQNSNSDSVRGLSRQTSERGGDDAGTISEADVFSGDEQRRMDASNAGAPSYIYSKYSLPRGRIVERNSAESRESWIRHQFQWEEAAPARQGLEPVSAPQDILLSPQSSAPPPSLPTTPNKNDENSHINRSRSAGPPGSMASRQNHKSTPSSPSVTSASTDRTIRGRQHTRNSPSQDIAGLSPEQHLERGIEAHNAGSLSKSTYHLRLAARAGLPTAMLLYALACRHGWGMRANQAEGVSWLRRAVDSSSLEFLADNDPLSTAAPGDRKSPMTPEQKSRKAQFALAIYELGMSYMNGWGIPRDRSLALRCFEIAGSWGDNDALAEAGFCYSQGIGCKKDLKKAAGFYRIAAEGGMSMAGNSWIYKPKYMDDPVGESTAAPRPGRARGKSFFGRKRAPVVT